MSVFENWPENLPREDLVRLLRGYATEYWRAEQALAGLFPDRYPLGDGEVIPADERVVLMEDLQILVAETIAEVERLRAAVPLADPEGTTKT